MAIVISGSAVFSPRVALLGPIITFALTMALFGFYTLLFGLACYFLFTGEHLAHRKLHITWIISLFILSTLGGLITVSSGLDDLAIQYTALLTQNPAPFVKAVTHYEKETVMVGFQYSCLVVVNVLADSVIIHRIFLIWGSNVWAIMLPVLAVIATNSVGLVGAIMKIKGFSNTTMFSNFELELSGVKILIGFYDANAVVNMLLTLAIAGRIWWVGLKTSQTFGHDGAFHNNYRPIIVVLLECGIIYPIILFAHAAISSNVDIVVPVGLTGVVVQVAGIAPTLIILSTWLRRRTAGQKVIEPSRPSTFATSSGPYSSRGPASNFPTLVQASQSYPAVISSHNLEVEMEMKRVTEEV
ncbi:hypothetical protein D9757_012479 [Collybiopsis confluens]|uniref:Uncharacterized protein n=1 Tax=Collybiopsis confluens TaxID=2823264 RepID=A0A8H5LG94_9AGAR|nr:hypothetical protein D9757_012479 [Collybiopsis confluens]